MAVFSLRTIALAALALFLVASSTTVDAKKKKDYKVINRENWPEAVGNAKYVMVYFYFTWCQNCRNFRKTWTDLKDKYKDDEEYVFLEIDCEDENGGDKYCTDYEINAVPDIMYGNVALQKSYKGSFTLKDLDEFLKTNMTEPLCSVVNPEHCPEKYIQNVRDIEKLTTDYLKAITSVGVKNPEVYAQQAAKKNGFSGTNNHFWYDLSGVEANRRKETDKVDGDQPMSATAEEAKAYMAERLAAMQSGEF